MSLSKSAERIDKILFVNARVIDPVNLTEKRRDVLVEQSNLVEIGKVERSGFAGKVIDLRGMILCPGLLDMHVHLREPGGEHKETVKTGCDAAMAGGVTGVCPMPNTFPAADTPEVVEFLKQRSRELLVDVFPIAAVSKEREGAELTDMEALAKSGAVAFSDDGDPVANAGLLRSALERATELDVPIIEHCEDKSLSPNWSMNAGAVSAQLGYKGIPGIAEELIVSRDIQLAEFTGGVIHIAHISTAKAVELVRQAKKRGVRVTCEVTPHHFTLNEEAVAEYGTNAKMSPPLRSQDDVDAILEGLSDGTIDVIATDHAPHSEDEKAAEFSKAPMGIVGLETALGLILTQLVAPGKLTLAQAVAKMTSQPADILHLQSGRFTERAPASLTIFDPDAEWVVDKSLFKSKSQNTPFHNWRLKGKVYGVYNKGLWWSTEFEAFKQ